MNKKVLKYLILGLAIAVPAFIFLFLQGFATNHYDLPIYYPKDSTKVEGKWVKTYHKVPSFRFTDQNGQTFDRKSLEGKIFIVEFFFTRCGAICPKMTSELERVQDMFADEEEVKIISFTIDPENDTPEVLKEYAQTHNAQSGKWFFLTGARQEIYDLAKNGFFVTALDASATVTPDFSHTSRLTLVDNKGRIRGYYNGVDSKEVDKLMVEASILLHELKASQ